MAVTVTYDDETSFPYVYRTTGGGVTWSSNLASLSVFDYFTDTAVVDDALYFSSHFGYPFHDVKFYVGTAFAATSKTLIWEYYTGSAWATLTVTDNTTGLTTLGENWVLFTPPADWANFCPNAPAGNNNAYSWIRCRISAVSGITEGGAQSTQTVRAKNLKLTVSGGTEATPANFTDIYDADAAAGWNKFLRYGSDNVVFESKAYLAINDYFTDTDKFIIWADGLITNDWGYIIYVNANAVVNFGTLTNEGRKITTGGCIFYFKENARAYHFISGNSTSTINLYSCAFKSNSFTRCNIGSVNRVWNCFGDRAGFRSIRSGVTDIANVIVCNTTENIANAPLSVDTFIAVGARVAGPPPNAEMFLKNCKVRHTSQEVTSWAANASQRLRLVNLDATWSEFDISWGGSPSGGEVWREYDLFLKVIDKNNAAISLATILITDKDGNTVLSGFTNPDGYINRNYGTAESGTATTLTDTDKSWTANQWKGHDILITSGTGVGQRTTISGNTATVLTFATLTTAPDSTSKYVIIPMITNCKWNYLNGVTPSATYNDHTMRISRSGYKTYQTKITIDKKIDDVISLGRILDNNFSKKVKINTK